MPMLSIVAHLSLVHANRFSAVVTVLCKHRIEAGKTERLSIAHYVPLAAQLFVALETSEMFHVPCTSFSLRALVGKDDLGRRD